MGLSHRGKKRAKSRPLGPIRTQKVGPGYTANVLLTPCPTCGRHGEYCVSVSRRGHGVNKGKVLGGPHSERVELAKKVAKNVGRP